MDTIIENTNITINENRVTVREGSSTTIGTRPKELKGYKITTQLPASGSEADIFIAEQNNIKYIIKYYRYGVRPKEEILQKIKSLSQQKPEEVVKVYDVGFDEEGERYYEILEYIENGSLGDIYYGKKVSKEIIVNILRELVSSLKTLHDENILHLDLKPTNILVRSQEPLDLVFTDFGISTFVDKETEKKMTVMKGTPLYFAPEAIAGVVGKESDYWSLGMIIYELAAGYHPFEKIDKQVILYTLITKEIEIEKSIDPDIRTLIEGLLCKNTKCRWGYNEVVRWLNGEVIYSKPIEKEIPVAAYIEENYNYEQEELLKSLLKLKKAVTNTAEGKSTEEEREYLLNIYSNEFVNRCRAISADSLEKNYRVALIAVKYSSEKVDFLEKIKEAYRCFNIIENSQTYLVPDDNNKEEFLIQNITRLIKKSEWEKLKREYIIPIDFSEPETLRKNQFREFLEFFHRNIALLISRETYNTLCQNYIIHSSWTNLEEMNSADYISIAEKIDKNKNEIFSVSEFNEICYEYGKYIFVAVIRNTEYREFIKNVSFLRENREFLVRTYEAEYGIESVGDAEFLAGHYREKIENIPKFHGGIAKIKLNAVKKIIHRGMQTRVINSIKDIIKIDPKLIKANMQMIDDFILDAMTNGAKGEMMDLIYALKNEGHIYTEVGKRAVEYIIKEYDENGAGEKAVELIRIFQIGDVNAETAKRYYMMQKPEAALEYLIKSAHEGNCDSIYKLGIVYSEGIGTEKNVEKGRNMFFLAASRGNMDAHRRLADINDIDEKEGSKKINDWKFQKYIIMMHNNSVINTGERLETGFLKISEDSEKIVTATENGKIKIWGRTTGLLLTTRIINNRVIDLSSTGISLYGTEDKVVYDYYKDKEGVRVTKGYPGDARGIISNTGKYLAFYAFDKSIYIHDTSCRTKTSELRYKYINAHRSIPLEKLNDTNIVFSGNDNYIAACGLYSEVRIWNVSQGIIESGMESTIEGGRLCLSYTGELCVRYGDGRIEVFDTGKGKKIFDIRRSGVRQVLFMGESSIFAAVSDRTIFFYSGFEEMPIYRIDLEEKIAVIDISKNGTILAIGNEKGEISVFEIDIFKFGKIQKNIE